MSSITIDPSTTEVSQFLKLLADPTRLEIVRRLAVREHCVCDFVDLFGISQPAISRHLKLLRSAGVIAERRERQWIYFRLKSDHEQYELLQRILEEVGEVEITSLNEC